MVRRPRKADPKAAEADERTVRTAALACLARRDFGKAELGERLRSRGYPSGLVDAVVEGLAAEQLLSDERFLEQFVAMHAARGHGPLRVRAELRERGIEPPEIEAALEQSPADWVELARKARQRKFGAAIPEGFRERAKQARFLHYRGFSAEQIRAALGPGEDVDP
jgi:regulatory protein